MKLNPKDRKDLAVAKDLLESPSLASILSDNIGVPIEKGFEYLPANCSEIVSNGTEKSLKYALRVAMSTMNSEKIRPPRNTSHKFTAVLSGAGGGAFNMYMLPFELPFSTTVMLRSIADIARSEGEKLSTVEARLACMQVFAFGRGSDFENSSEQSYFVVRAGLDSAVRAAAQHIAKNGLAEEGAPVIVKLIARLSARFGVAVSNKAAAQAVPVIGAVGGATVNWVFMSHFQNMARGHFTIRRLERMYGIEDVRREYEQV